MALRLLLSRPLEDADLGWRSILRAIKLDGDIDEYERLTRFVPMLAKDGEVLLSEALGGATPDTRYIVFSATKGVVAGAVWLLIGEGKLHPDQKVVEVIPDSRRRQ